MIHEENGQIIVDELRPMGELKAHTFVLIKLKLSGTLKVGSKLHFIDLVNIGGKDTPFEECEGWIPCPIYRPKDGK